jgi:diphosphomevalonate decarboxylase
MQPVTAEAQPNIALIKYWGKRDVDRNLPAVSSLSVTLDSLRTSMTVQFDDALADDELTVNGEAAPGMQERVSSCLDRVAGSARGRARVSSASNFPIGAGLASSAAAFAALVVAADAAVDGRRDTLDLARLAGEASGSAARSLYGGFVVLTAGDTQVDLEQLAGPQDWPLEVVVAVTEKGRKPVGSGTAMQRSARTSPFYSRWVAEQDDDLRVARDAVIDRDFVKLAAVAEHNCLKMHSVMWTSRPAIVYWNAATVACMETIRALQAAGLGVFFTIDAGPQVKAVCLPDSGVDVELALRRTPGVVETMRSSLGLGARLGAA